MAVLPTSHPLAGHKKVSLRELKGERWIALNDRGFPGFKAVMQQIMQPAQIAPKFGRAADSLRSMVTLVAAGEGAALIPEAFLWERLGGLAYVQTDCVPFELYAVWLKSAPAEAMECFYSVLSREVAKPAS
jgi:DNA-binding transcriptional LysR family regulator